MKYVSVNKQKCEHDCPLGQMRNLDNHGVGHCVQCTLPNCSHCDPDDPKKCFVCDQAGGYKMDLFTLKCVTSCTNGQYQKDGQWDGTAFDYPNNVAKSECFPCDGNGCLTCSNPNSPTLWDHCDSCLSGLSRVVGNDGCIAVCPIHQYSAPVEIDGTNPKQYENWKQCTPCNDQTYCKTCNGPGENDCTACINGRHLSAGKCIVDCPEGYYANFLGLCTPCPFSRCK